MDHQAPLSLGILQAGILGWVAMPFSRGSSQPRYRTWVSHITGRLFILWGTKKVWQPLTYPSFLILSFQDCYEWIHTVCNLRDWVFLFVFFFLSRCLLLGRKVMANLDSILKSRDITLPTKVHLVKAMVFPLVMYGCESWTVKKAEHRKLMLLNCGVGEDSWESLGLQGDPTSPS